MTSLYQILDKHTIIDMLCSKWTSYCISHLRLRFRWHCSEKFILAKKINDSIYIVAQMYWILPKLISHLWKLHYQLSMTMKEEDWIITYY